MKKKKFKTTQYRRIIESLKKQFYGGNFDNFSDGNTTHVSVKNPYQCCLIFQRFDKLKSEK